MEGIRILGWAIAYAAENIAYAENMRLFRPHICGKYAYFICICDRLNPIPIRGNYPVQIYWGMLFDITTKMIGIIIFCQGKCIKRDLTKKKKKKKQKDGTKTNKKWRRQDHSKKKATPDLPKWMTTAKPPKMRTAKRGPPSNAEGKRGGFETRSTLTRKNTKTFEMTRPPDHPTLLK